MMEVTLHGQQMISNIYTIILPNCHMDHFRVKRLQKFYGIWSKMGNRRHYIEMLSHIITVYFLENFSFLAEACQEHHMEIKKLYQ